MGLIYLMKAGKIPPNSHIEPMGENKMYQGMGWVGPAISAGSTILSSIFGGGGGRGDYQKFDREVRPIFEPRARNSGLAVYGFWFGEVVGIDSSGALSVLGPASDMYDAGAKLQQYVDQTGIPVTYYADAVFYDIHPADASQPENPTVTPPIAISFPPGTSPPPMGTTAPGENGAGAMTAIGVVGGTALLLFLMKGRKKKS